MKNLVKVCLLFKNGDVAEVPSKAIDYFSMENFKRSYIWDKNEITGTATSKIVISVESIDLIIDCEAIKSLNTQFGKNMKNRLLKLSDVDYLHTVLYSNDTEEYHLGWNPDIGMNICNPNQRTIYTGDKIKIEWRFSKEMPCTKTDTKIGYY